VTGVARLGRSREKIWNGFRCHIHAIKPTVSVSNTTRLLQWLRSRPFLLWASSVVVSELFLAVIGIVFGRQSFLNPLSYSSDGLAVAPSLNGLWESLQVVLVFGAALTALSCFIRRKVPIPGHVRNELPWLFGTVAGIGSLLRGQFYNCGPKACPDPTVTSELPNLLHAMFPMIAIILLTYGTLYVISLYQAPREEE
jgi:hypothetical protein